MGQPEHWQQNLEEPGEEPALNLFLLFFISIPPVPPPVGLPDDPEMYEHALKWEVFA